jgi:hypothetical protein
MPMWEYFLEFTGKENIENSRRPYMPPLRFLTCPPFLSNRTPNNRQLPVLVVIYTQIKFTKF